MTKLISAAVALGLALGMAAPAFAADAPKDKAGCEKAHMKWDDATKKCGK
jgi:hypothetical protein